MKLLEDTGLVVNFIILIVAFVGSVAYAWASLKNGKSKINKETIESYEKSIAAFEIRLNQLEESNREKDLKISELTSQLDKLTGAKIILEQTLSLRDPELFKKLVEGLSSMHDLCKVFYTHNENAISIRKTQLFIEKQVEVQLKTSKKLIDQAESNNKVLIGIDNKIGNINRISKELSNIKKVVIKEEE